MKKAKQRGTGGRYLEKGNIWSEEKKIREERGGHVLKKENVTMVAQRGTWTAVYTF